MNKRIRKKMLAGLDALIANSLSLYVDRPRGNEYEELAREFLCMSIGLKLYFRLQLMPGPRRGWGIGPPEDLGVEWLGGDKLVARGVVRLSPRGKAPDVVETLHFSAERTARGWRHVTLTFGGAP